MQRADRFPAEFRSGEAGDAVERVGVFQNVECVRIHPVVAIVRTAAGLTCARLLGRLEKPGYSYTRLARMYTQVVEDYLKAIWMLQQTEAPVSTSRIAERLGLTAAAVTAMVKRLAEQKLLRHEPYYGVRLTPAGELAGIRIIRRHRVLELFLTEMLGYEWDCVHEEAERLEHAASDELIERLARLLGEPERDPHGSVIPTASGEVDQAVYPTLGEVKPGDTGRVVEVRIQEAEQLRYLGTLDLYPGASVAVVGRAPIEGPRTQRGKGGAPRRAPAHPAPTRNKHPRAGDAAPPPPAAPER
jgi:DtxR family Mn-dependent transcriptional regulator